MDIFSLTALPVSVIIFFILHWFSIRGIKTSQERLKSSRITYLGLSLQLLIFSIFLGFSVGDSNEEVFGWKFLPVVLGMGFSFLGDVFNLHFPSIQKKIKYPLLGGIAGFFVAQIFYMLAIFNIEGWNDLFQENIHYGILILLLIVPAVIFKFRVYNPERPKSIMASAFVYGILLCYVEALLLNGALIHSGYWWILALGGGFFLLSDAVMGETTVHGGRHPVFEFQVPWITYLIAQSLLIVGFYLEMKL